MSLCTKKRYDLNFVHIDNFDYSSCKEAIDCGTLQPVVKAMTTFEYDMELQLQGAIFIRRIARNGKAIFNEIIN